MSKLIFDTPLAALLVTTLVILGATALAQPPTTLTTAKAAEMATEIKGLREAYHQERITMQKHCNEQRKALDKQFEADREAIRSRSLAIPTPPQVAP
jgi:hypothetical protein